MFLKDDTDKVSLNIHYFLPCCSKAPLGNENQVTKCEDCIKDWKGNNELMKTPLPKVVKITQYYTNSVFYMRTVIFDEVLPKK